MPNILTYNSELYHAGDDNYNQRHNRADSPP